VGRDFQRSKWFGLIGVVVVAVLAAAIALVFGSGDANPTAAMAAILGLVFAFVAVLLVLQRRDLERAAARDERAATAPTEGVVDPTIADDNSLLAALATEPLDHEAMLRARRGIWGLSRDSIGSTGPMIALIFCAVVPWQLFQFVWSMVIFVPIIVAYAGYLSAKALGSGGALDQGYAASAELVKPLGLSLVERPTVTVERRIGGPGKEVEVEGEVVYAGNRHGRQVSVRIERGATITVAGEFESFEVRARGERLVADDAAPPTVAAVLAPLRSSSYWKGVQVAGGADGIVVERKRDGALHWMRDLWLAERLAAVTAVPARAQPV
jgi:hypothetical protein